MTWIPKNQGGLPWYDPYGDFPRPKKQPTIDWQRILAEGDNTERIKRLEKAIADLTGRVDIIDDDLSSAEDRLFVLENPDLKEKADTPSDGVPAEIDDAVTEPHAVCNCMALYTGFHPWWCKTMTPP